MLGWSQGAKEGSIGWQDLEGGGKDLLGKVEGKDEAEGRV